MSQKVLSGTLKNSSLRDTQTRRLVTLALETICKPCSPTEIIQHIKESGATINLTTVYRILETFEAHHIVHRHPCNGKYALCAMPDAQGAHGFLHCHACGKTEEFVNADLQRTSDRIARSSGYQPSSHVTEILGTCITCLRLPST